MIAGAVQVEADASPLSPQSIEGHEIRVVQFNKRLVVQRVRERQDGQMVRSRRTSRGNVSLGGPQAFAGCRPASSWDRALHAIPRRRWEWSVAGRSTGYSWTPSLENAQWFANRARACYDLRNPGVYRIVATEDDVLAYINDGQQEEFIVHPGNVRKPQLVCTWRGRYLDSRHPRQKRRRTSTDCQTAVGNELNGQLGEEVHDN